MSEKPLVYLETSFISHLTARPSRDPLHAAKQQSSRQWWETCREQFTLVISPTVYEECREGEPVMAGKRLGLLEENVFLFPQNPAILELAKRFLAPAGPLPSKAEADALHIASAGVYGCEFLLTWNFKHIANAIIKRRVERILHEYGYESPTICTPDELLGELA
jgi:hypothetical protein